MRAVILLLAFGLSGISAFTKAPINGWTRPRVAQKSEVTMMAKKSVADLTDEELKGKKVLVRCDLNVPLDGKTITDDTQIRASVPTLKYLVEKGAEVAAMVDGMSNGDVILLENTRFYKEEEKNEAGFVEKFAAPFDMFVNDAFGTAHRAHASTEGVTKFLSPAVS